MVATVPLSEPTELESEMVSKMSMLPVISDPAVKKDEKSRPMSKTGIFAAMSYMICAVLLVLFNKAALSSYNFPCSNVLTLLQMITSSMLLLVLFHLNIIKFSSDGANTKAPITFRTLRRVFPLSLSYLFYMIIGMASIRGVNVPIYTTLRRTTVVFTLIMEKFISGQNHSYPVVCSIIIIVFGAIISGYSDLSFDLYSYCVVFLSNATTAIYLAMISRLGKSVGLNNFGLMLSNGIICMPLLLLWTFLSGELFAAIRFPALNELPFQMVLVMSCVLAFGLNYTIFLNTNLNSALTQTMCGNLKDLGTVSIGWVLFGGLPFNFINVFGQSLGFLGSGAYAYCKLYGK